MIGSGNACLIMHRTDNLLLLELVKVLQIAEPVRAVIFWTQGCQ